MGRARMDARIAPCPVCGHRRAQLKSYYVKNKRGRLNTRYYVKCHKCGNKGKSFEAGGEGFNPMSIRSHKNAEKKAIDRWNDASNRKQVVNEC